MGPLVSSFNAQCGCDNYRPAMQGLDAALQEAEEQQVEAHRAHAQTIDRLVETHAGRLDAALQQYEDHRKVPECRLAVTECLSTCLMHPWVFGIARG